jgi:hypothetical protein
MEPDFDQFWIERREQLRKWRKNHPEHGALLYRISKNFEKMHVEYIKLMQDYQHRNKKSSREQAEKLQSSAEKLFDRLSRLELLASLSK